MKIDGVMVDMFTASAIMKVYDAVADRNKKRMETLKAPKLADMAMTIMSMRKMKEDTDLTEKAKVSGYYQKNKEPRHKNKTDKNSSTEQLIHDYLEASDTMDKSDFGSTPYDFASGDLDYLGSLLKKRGFSNRELNKMADKFSRDEKYPMIKEDIDLTEKAESEAQATAARIALKHKREGTEPEKGSASEAMMKMSEKDLEDFTKVKKGAPEKVKEEMDLMESDFKVGDKVTCIESGMKGEVIKLDKPETGKYYTVRREDGKEMKYAPDELKKVMKEEKMDDVNKAALKKKFKNRKDKDIDNDGDVDDTDEYLHKRRKAVSKAMAKEQSETKLKEKDVDMDGDADALDKSKRQRQQKALDTSE